MKHYERIKAMSIDELAEFMYSAADKICFDNCTQDTGNKYSCKFGEYGNVFELEKVFESGYVPKRRNKRSDTE